MGGNPSFCSALPGFLYQNVRKESYFLDTIEEIEENLKQQRYNDLYKNGFFSRGFNLSIYARQNQWNTCFYVHEESKLKTYYPTLFYGQ